MDDKYGMFYEGADLVERIRLYILSVSAAAMICSMVLSLCDKKGLNKAAIRMLCGIFIAITMIDPLLEIRLPDISMSTGIISGEATAAAEEGRQAAVNAVGAIIKQRTESYILDKADAMGLELIVQVILDRENQRYPQCVRIQGTASPYAKRQLQLWISEKLGIAEEKQIWT